MIILTGGAGMIGSMIAWHLNTILNENKFVVFDDLVNQDQEKNLYPKVIPIIVNAIKLGVY